MISREQYFAASDALWDRWHRQLLVRGLKGSRRAPTSGAGAPWLRVLKQTKAEDPAQAWRWADQWLKTKLPGRRRRT
jgi:hypothetical protein